MNFNTFANRSGKNVVIQSTCFTLLFCLWGEYCDQHVCLHVSKTTGPIFKTS